MTPDHSQYTDLPRLIIRTYLTAVLIAPRVAFNFWLRLFGLPAIMPQAVSNSDQTEVAKYKATYAWINGLAAEAREKGQPIRVTSAQWSELLGLPELLTNLSLSAAAMQSINDLAKTLGYKDSFAGLYRGVPVWIIRSEESELANETISLIRR